MCHALILSRENQQCKRHPQFALWIYTVAYDEQLLRATVSIKTFTTPWTDWRKEERKAVSYDRLCSMHHCGARVGMMVSLLMCVISQLLPTLASQAKTCQELVAFLSLSL